MTLRFGILTVSDRSARSERQDASGPALVERIQAQGWEVIQQSIVPDDAGPLGAVLVDWADGGKLDIILTTGGTGFTPRDVTPEATQAVIHRQAPGLVEFMRAESCKVTPHAMLSRAVAGIRGSVLIINLPGSPKAAVENFNSIVKVLPHAVALMRNDPGSDLHGLPPD